MKHLGNTLKLFLGASLALGATVGTAAAATIVPVSAFSAAPITPTRSADHTIDGSGLDGLGQHSDANGDGIGWLADIINPTIVFDLGAAYDLTSMRVWNYNEHDRTYHGVRDMNLFVSLDDISYTALGPQTLLEAYGLPTDLGQFYLLTATARYVKFDILNNYDPTNAFTEQNDGGTMRVGLSEIQFEGTATPEPSTFVLLGLTTAVAGIIRRKTSTL